MNHAKRTPSRYILDETPLRALTLLRALGILKPVRALLAAHGYSEEDHVEGWQLLFKASGYAAPRPRDERARGGSRRSPSTPPPAAESPVDNAIKELADWESGAFRRARAALARLHPEQEAFVFQGLEDVPRTEAVLGLTAFLDRLDALERAPERKATRKGDLAALHTLAARGITADERTRLRALLALAQSSPAADVDASLLHQRRDVELAALRAWYDDWAETARTVVTRRDHLIRMGLAKRRARKPGGQPKASGAIKAPAGADATEI